MPFGNPTKTMRRLRSLLGLSPEGTGRSLKRGTRDPGGCLILQALFAEENIYWPVYSGRKGNLRQPESVKDRAVLRFAVPSACPCTMSRISLGRSLRAQMVLSAR